MSGERPAGLVVARAELDQPRLLLLDDEHVAVLQQRECLAAHVLVLDPGVLPSVLVAHVKRQGSHQRVERGRENEHVPGVLLEHEHPPARVGRHRLPLRALVLLGREVAHKRAELHRLRRRLRAGRAAIQPERPVAHGDQLARVRDVATVAQAGELGQCQASDRFCRSFSAIVVHSLRAMAPKFAPLLTRIVEDLIDGGSTASGARRSPARSNTVLV